LVENVVGDFIRLHAKRHNRRWREAERLLLKDVVPAWRGRRLSDIQRKNVVKLLDDIVERGAPIAANRTLARLRRLGSWAVERGILDRNPCDGVKAPSPEVERERVLTNEELSLVWRAAEQLPAYCNFVRLLVLTGQRRSEVGGLRWAEIDLPSATWTLPSERSKNSREHAIPLSTAAVDILTELPKVDGAPFVLTRLAPLSSYTDAKAQLDAAIANLNSGKPIAHWTFHDIRRSVATQMAEMNVAPHVVEAVLNHRSGVIRGVARIYNKYSYAAEKRAALEAWARKLDAIVTGKPGSNVIELAPARVS